MNAFDMAAAQHWAMTEPALRQLLAVADRATDGPEAVEARLGRPLDNTEGVAVRNGVAVIPVRGPLFRYANMFTRISGATSYQITATDFTAALENPKVSAILLNIDSPGGEVNGAGELAALIRAGRAAGKPIGAYVGGMGASAAYWVASAADFVVADPTAMLGAVGVIWVARVKSDAERKTGPKEIVIVSDQSPEKHTDPDTDEGYARMRALATQLAGVFIQSVAEYRGVTAEHVVAEFGRGWIRIGADAVEAGLADRLGTFESTLAELGEHGRTKGPRGPFTTARSSVMATEPNTPAAETQEPASDPTPETAPSATGLTLESLKRDHAPLAAALIAEGRAEGVKQENDRICAIEDLALTGHGDLVAEAKADPSVTPEVFASRQIKAEQEAGGQALRTIKQEEADLDAPAATAAPEGDEQGPTMGSLGRPSRTKVQRVLSAGRRQGVSPKKS